MTYPAFVFWVLLVAAMAWRGPAIYTLFFVSWSFGTLAMLPPQVMGASLMPAWVIAAFLSVRTLVEVGPRAYAAALVDLRRFGVLMICTGYVVVSGVLLPRIFTGRIDVIPMRADEPGAVTVQASASNLIQALYFLLTSLTVVNVYFAAREPAKRRALLTAFAWGAAAAVLTGLVDQVASAAGLQGLLEPYRNAAYALLTDNEVSDMKRVVGLMSEASAYAALCISFLGPLAMTPDSRSAAPWGRWRLPLAIALLVFTYLSTSSGGYVAIVGVGLVVVVGVAVGLAESRRPAWIAAYCGLLLLVAALGVMLFRPDATDALADMVDKVVLEKTHTASYVERSMWNRMAFEAFVQSGGLGAGVGCCRASSWIFALLGNIGAPGTALMAAFLAQVFLARAVEPQDRGLLRLVKLSILPCLLVVSLTSPSVGFGLGAAWLCGLAVALGSPSPSKAPSPARAGAARAATEVVPGFGLARFSLAARRRDG